ncbi:MAG: hypothetical protein ACTS4V_01030 [Candidatus Hodgkinia cicadicola]
MGANMRNLPSISFVPRFEGELVNQNASKRTHTHCVRRKSAPVRNGATADMTSGSLKQPERCPKELTKLTIKEGERGISLTHTKGRERMERTNKLALRALFLSFASASEARGSVFHPDWKGAFGIITSAPLPTWIYFKTVNWTSKVPSTNFPVWNKFRKLVSDGLRDFCPSEGGNMMKIATQQVNFRGCV